MCIRDRELPARREEVEHAQEEGIIFRLLTNPVRVLGDENGWVKGMECVSMELGEPDESGRRPVSYTHLDVYKRQGWMK